VRQIVANLVDNAYRYSEPESQVIVRVREIEDHIQVDVQDQGIGIYPDEHERIFERFYRGENPLVFASAGTGLGLAIVRELIEMHTGRIWLTSSGVPGEGSTFSFVLPVYDPEKELKPTRLEGNVYG
jgi:two-component system sensor histidine kinase SenX3